MTDRPIFVRTNQNSPDKVHKPTIPKSKIYQKIIISKGHSTCLSFSIFELWVCGLYRPNFDLSGRISADRSYFRKIYLSNSFHPHLSPITRLIFLCIFDFVNFLQIPYFTVFHVLARSSSRGVLMTKIF